MLTYNFTKSLVSKCQYTLFVGVDEYDSPVNTSAFGGLATGVISDVKIITNIENFFKGRFFAALKQGCGSMNNGRAPISKYFVTGVIPAFHSGVSALLDATIISHYPKMHGACGFTEDEVKTIVQHYLHICEEDAKPIVDLMRKLYNGYCFCENISGTQPALLYNPHSPRHEGISI